MATIITVFSVGESAPPANSLAIKKANQYAPKSETKSGSRKLRTARAKSASATASTMATALPDPAERIYTIYPMATG